MTDVIQMLNYMDEQKKKYPWLAERGMLFMEIACLKCNTLYRLPFKPGKCDCLMPIEDLDD